MRRIIHRQWRQLHQQYWFRWLLAFRLAFAIWRKPWRGPAVPHTPEYDPFDDISWKTAWEVATGVWEIEP